MMYYGFTSIPRLDLAITVASSIQNQQHATLFILMDFPKHNHIIRMGQSILFLRGHRSKFEVMMYYGFTSIPRLDLAITVASLIQINNIQPFYF